MKPSEGYYNGTQSPGYKGWKCVHHYCLDLKKANPVLAQNMWNVLRMMPSHDHRMMGYDFVYSAGGEIMPGQFFDSSGYKENLILAKLASDNDLEIAIKVEMTEYVKNNHRNW